VDRLDKVVTTLHKPHRPRDYIAERLDIRRHPSSLRALGCA